MSLPHLLYPLRRTAAVFALASTGLAGCVGTLDDPDRFGDGSFCPADIEVEALFAQRCGGAVCHGAGEAPAGGLDLESPGLAERIAGVPAQECAGWDLMVPDDPDSSFLLSKLEGPPPGCGDPMPIVGQLSESEIACVRSWIAANGEPGAQEDEQDLLDATDGAVQ